MLSCERSLISDRMEETAVPLAPSAPEGSFCATCRRRVVPTLRRAFVDTRLTDILTRKSGPRTRLVIYASLTILLALRMDLIFHTGSRAGAEGINP